MTEFTEQDYRNMLAVLSRCNYDGIDEAQAAVVLKHKITGKLDELALTEEVDGDDATNVSEPDA